jgi:hypothetical protein
LQEKSHQVHCQSYMDESALLSGAHLLTFNCVYASTLKVPNYHIYFTSEYF